MTIQDLFDKFNETLQKNSWWARFTNSQFVKMMAIFGAQVIYYAQTFAERALAEGFISTATKRSSILAAAEDKGYVGRLITPSHGLAAVRNKTAERIQLPAFSTYLSEQQYPYMILDVLDIPAGETIKDISIKQMEIVNVTKVVQQEEDFMSVTLPKSLTAECVKIDVYVTIDGVEELWEENPQFRLATGTSQNYVLFYKPTEQLGIRFGDGSIGKKPPEGSLIDIHVWCSAGDITLVEGQKLIPSNAFSPFTHRLDIVTTSPITGGAGSETTEEIRNRAQYYIAYDDQVVWGGDYKFYLKSKIVGTSWLNIWGEQQQEKATGIKDLNNINAIFICGHKPNSTQEWLKKEILDALESIPNALNKKFVYVDSHELPFTIKLTGIARKSVIISDAKNQLRERLTTQFGRDASTFDANSTGDFEQIRVNNLWACVESLGVLVEFNIEVIGMTEATQLNDFIYLDTEHSVFDISY
ncbi:baseplate protein [Xenorhabdus sp. 42]|uniref:baseplate protein n=1 Tax=Xenorhabdus szentirmaii TaxID=290112 RepID=UPI001991FA6F|nr:MULTISPECIES: baseplate protein [unclassified Xenorhabdus]MBD2782227.1 baseplate protein [Xenorhabdus sp. 38]MBD2819736.1 baseplate protein [Xenorhabdus sp. 42]